MSSRYFQPLNFIIMSRYSKKLENGQDLAYGYDSVTGYFIQVFSPELEDGEDVLLVDECSTFTSLSNARMIDLMTEYGASSEHIEYVVLDLPF